MTKAVDPWRELGLRDAAMAGDAAAWRELFDANEAALTAFVRWRAQGEDVVQETWVTAVDRLARFDPERGTFQNWLRGIAANVIRNALRKHRRERARECGQECGPDCEPGARNDERVALTLAELPARYEQVLRWKYLDALTVAEIAETTGQGEKAVESLLSRAREAFRESYTAED